VNAVRKLNLCEKLDFAEKILDKKYRSNRIKKLYSDREISRKFQLKKLAQILQITELR